MATIDKSGIVKDTFGISGGQFASSEALAELNSLTKKQLDAQNPTIAAALEKK